MDDERELLARIARALGNNIRKQLFTKIPQAKKIVIFGHNALGLTVGEMLARGGKKADYLTGFPHEPIPPEAHGLATISFAELKALPGEDTLVCITAEENMRVIAALADMQLNNFIDFNYLHYTALFDPALIYDNMSAITEAWAMLADDESRETFISVLEYRLTADPRRLQIAPWPQYFHPLVQPRKKDVIIDGGAFIGDTALAFARHVDRDCMIFSFEPAAENYQALVGMIHEQGLEEVVLPVKTGLWRRSEILAFDDSLRDGSHIGGQGGSKIKVLDLNTFAQRVRVSPTLIKLDVEAAETNVLQGAEDLIKKQLPRLQVCVYHLPADLWEIPLMLKRISEKYRIFLGHHWLKHDGICNYCETVAYATAE